MENDFSIELAEHTLEYFDDEHLYLVDGIIVPSITQILKVRFGNKYSGIDKATLQKAADAGTAVHEAIERYINTGEECDLPELRNFKFLQKHYHFEVLNSEVPVMLFLQEEPIAAGRLDLVLGMPDEENGYLVGGADIKRTSTLDKDYLFYQLNLYRIAYRQSYGHEWQFLKGIHLREATRKFVDIPINENLAWQLVHDYMNKEIEQ